MLLALVRRLPDWATPDHLTAIGLFGAGLTLLGFIGCHWSNGFLVLVVGGLFLNWFGNSLDGTLARHRSIERPHYGYFIDHSSDLIAQNSDRCRSGRVALFHARLIAAGALALSADEFLHLSEGRHGAGASVVLRRHGRDGVSTSRRVLGAFCSLGSDPALTTAQAYGFVVLDLVIGGLSGLTFLGFVVVIQKDLARMQREEREIMESLQPALAAHEPSILDVDDQSLIEPAAN